MFDINNVRQDFPMLQDITMQGKPLIYFDSAATTLKPSCVIESVCNYLSSYTSSVHRGDYDLSHQVDDTYEKSRETTSKLLNCNRDEVVFTYGTSDSINMIAFGYAINILKEGDEILLTLSEHASNILPWFEVSKQTGAVIKYINLIDGRVTMNEVEKAITKNTKIISLAQITNVLGYEVPIKEICKYAHTKNIIVCVDGAQSVPHEPVNVKELDVDFFSFSGHKCCGPTGIGVLYGKFNLLQEMNPTRFGGGSNASFTKDGNYILKNAPYKFETGTPNIEGVIGLGKALEYLMNIGMDNIQSYEHKLRSYAVEQLSLLNNVEIYNQDAVGPVIFNIKNVFSQDAASLFNKHGIAVRSGQHCAKMLGDVLPVKNTIRASFYFYNTIEEINEFIEVCKKGDDFLDAFFG